MIEDHYRPLFIVFFVESCTKGENIIFCRPPLALFFLCGGFSEQKGDENCLFPFEEGKKITTSRKKVKTKAIFSPPPGNCANVLLCLSHSLPDILP